ncbi:oligosaccharide flippase family protein [Chryseobacterium sp.]|uniref:oligosaccharide flippase family protein n=1 Tax=Chryseobacterium sp. TaxID=1871047 RepID=UPI0028A09518|nr:oligosaccharide flippase family protein [Chryseobacterium sp.]
MKVRGLKINYLLNLIRTILTALIGFFTMPFVNKTLGVESVGKYEYINSVISYFVLFSALGIPMYGIREIAKVREKEIERSLVSIELLIILLLTSIIAYLVVFGVLLNLEQFRNYHSLILIICPTIFLTNMGAEWFFQAMEDQLYITIRFVIVKIITLIMLFSIIDDPDDYLKYAFVMLVSTVGSNVFNFIYIKKYIKIKHISWSQISIKRHFKGITTIFLATVSVSIYLQLDNTLLGIYGGDEAVGIYAVANKLVRFAILFVTTLGSVMLPRLSLLYSNCDYDQYYEYLEKALKYILFFSLPVCCMIFSLSKEVISLVGGTEFLRAVVPMKILSLLIILIGLAYFFAFMILYPQGREKIYTVIVMISAFVSVLLNIIFIPKYYEISTSLVSVFVETIGVVLLMFFARKTLRKIGFFSISNCNYFVAVVIQFGVFFLVSLLNLDNLLMIIVGSILSLISYFVVLILFNDYIIVDVVSKLKVKFSR